MAYSPHVAVDLGFEIGEGEAEGRPEDQGLVPQLFRHEYEERRQGLRYPASTGGFQICQPVTNQLAMRSLLFQLNLLSFVYDCGNKILPLCFHSFFKLVESVHRYGTRQANKMIFSLPRKIRCNTALGQCASMELNAGMTFLWV